MNKNISVDQILEALDTQSQRCTYNALANYLEISLPQLFSALGIRRPKASWIVNQGTLKPTGYLAHQEHDQLYSQKYVIREAGELETFLRLGSVVPIAPKGIISSETICYGVDGCKGGWIFARLEGNSLSFGTVRKVKDLILKVESNSHVFIDIPIGLRDNSPEGRLCDIQARKLLKPHRACSVFSAPIRPLLDQPDYEPANKMSRELIGKGISRQTFNIMGKIGEIDILIRENDSARSLIREVHPEICFYGLAAGRPMEHGKKTMAGFHERLALIEEHRPGATRAISQALVHYPRKQVSADDILDAVVAAITAATPERWATIPVNPERDSLGLPMEMVYLQSRDRQT